MSINCKKCIPLHWELVYGILGIGNLVPHDFNELAIVATSGSCQCEEMGYGDLMFIRSETYMWADHLFGILMVHFNCIDIFVHETCICTSCTSIFTNELDIAWHSILYSLRFSCNTEYSNSDWGGVHQEDNQKVNCKHLI